MGLTRREFFARPLARLFLKPSPPWKEGEVPGLIPLSALGELPDEVIMDMIPVLRAGWAVQVVDAGVAYTDSGGQEGLVPFDAAGCLAVHMFDGKMTLGEVATAVAAECGMTAAEGIVVAREAFVALALKEVYHPDRPLEPMVVLKAGEE
jgi:hypothetical protein